MAVSGTSLSLLGRSAISNAAGARSSQRAAPARVEPTDPLKDSTSREYRALQELKVRDREVRQHEQAHNAAGGQHVRGGPTYSYERGPERQSSPDSDRNAVSAHRAGPALNAYRFAEASGTPGTAPTPAIDLIV